MNKLLSSNLSRLWKDKTFWLCMIAMLIYAIVYMLNACRLATVSISEYDRQLDKYYFHFALSIGLFCALISSMFLGTEYSDGTIRNKIIVGHTRTSIYIANSITVFFATILIMFVWLIGALIGIPTLGIWKMGIPNMLAYLLVAIAFIAAFSAIFTMVSMLSTSKAITVAVSILLYLGLLLLSTTIYNGLVQPEMIKEFEIIIDGVDKSEFVANPEYISGMKRTMYEFILGFLPTGQGLNMWLLEIGNHLLMIAFSVFITIVTTLSGIFVFRKKNLK